MKRSREPEETSQEAPSSNSNPSIHSTSSNVQLQAISSGEAETCPPAAKMTELDLSDSNTDSSVKMRCSLPPHKEPLVFSSYSEYEAHYRDQHTNRCAECRKNFPSSHLLSLHIEETHDSFAAVRKERGERTVSRPRAPSTPIPRLANCIPETQYSCFVEGCDRKCSTPQKRKMHLIDKHMYPKNFFFAITRDGIDGRRSLLHEGGGRRRRSSAAAATRPAASTSKEEVNGTEVDAAGKPAAPSDDRTVIEPDEEDPAQRPDQEMEDLSSAMSALQFVPLSVRFGRGRKAGFAKK